MHLMRGKRHQAILEIIRRHQVENQESLSSLLKERGIEVTQATLSRDLRALGVVKEPLPEGSYRYRQATGASEEAAVGNLRRFMLDVLKSGQLLVVKTRTGGAQPVALALDQLEVEGVLGTVAGDDTVLAVVAEDAEPSTVIDAVWRLVR